MLGFESNSERKCCMIYMPEPQKEHPAPQFANQCCEINVEAEAFTLICVIYIVSLICVHKTCPGRIKQIPDFQDHMNIHHLTMILI